MERVAHVQRVSSVAPCYGTNCAKESGVTVNKRLVFSRILGTEKFTKLDRVRCRNKIARPADRIGNFEFMAAGSFAENKRWRRDSANDVN